MFTARTNGVSTRCCFPSHPVRGVMTKRCAWRTEHFCRPLTITDEVGLCLRPDPSRGPAYSLYGVRGLRTSLGVIPPEVSDGTFTDIAGFGTGVTAGGDKILIPVAPLAFAPERQGRASRSLSPLVFLPVSTHFTATPEIPSASPAFKFRSFERPLPVGPGAFTFDFRNRLRALYAQ